MPIWQSANGSALQPQARACLHLVNIQHSDSMAIDRGSKATASPWHFVWWTQWPHFAGDRQLIRRSCSPQNGWWRTWSSPHWCDKWSTSAVLSCQFDSSVRDHQPSDYVVRSPFWSPNLIFSQVHSLLRKKYFLSLLRQLPGTWQLHEFLTFSQRFLVLVFHLSTS